jgi:hypothetical protein
MNDLFLKYQNTKEKAQRFMTLGDISAYINTLIELNKQKQLMQLVLAN